MTERPPRHPEAPLDTSRRHREAGVAVSPHYLASRVAAEIMERGGNAVDAAVALNAVLGVVLPDTCGPGGDLFALVHVPGTDTPLALNASGRAGSGADAQLLRSSGLTEIPARSAATITVPGCVDGWEALLDKMGSLSLATVLRPAIELAADGFPVSPELAASLRRIEKVIIDQPSAPPLYPEGRRPEPGAVVKRPRLAETLRALSQGGRDSFYLGEVGTAISAATAGVITRADLAVRQADWIEPIGLDALGATGWTIPPNSQGYIALAAAWAFDRLTDLDDPFRPQYQHALIEAYRMFAWERDDLVADPSFAELTPEELLAVPRLTERAQTFDPTSANVWPAARDVPGGTAFMCTRDSSGMAVALVQSNYHGIGSGISAWDTGVFLHDRGAGFNLTPGHPNEMAPGKRPLHTLSPTLWTKDGNLKAVIGTRGGQYQPQYLVQIAAGLFRSKLDPPTVQAAPRWQVDGIGPGDDHVVNLEPALNSELGGALSALSHRVREVPAWQHGWGPVSIITQDETGVRGSADPRISTAAAVGIDADSRR